MNDLCTLAHYQPDDLSTHAVSLAVMAWVLRHANASGSALDRAAFHRAADLALVLFREEERRFSSADASAPLLDGVYLKAFVPEAEEAFDADGSDEDDDEKESRAESRAATAVAARFQREVLRRIHQRPAEMPVGCEELAW
ncbi:MAG: hypothetical protein WBD06_15255 [Acidobacteriaceae bacterium]